MAFGATTAWEVRVTGSDSNGGGFDASLGGVDYSQQDSPQATGTVTSSGTTVTATTSIFTSAMVGNFITDGTTWKEITAFTSATVVTVDSAPSWTSASIRVGGALASPGKAAGLMVGGNQLWIKSGTYSITSATPNVTGGCVSLPNSASATAITQMYGYQTTRGDGGTKPLLQASGISTFTLVLAGAGNHIENVSAGGSSLTSSRGFDLTAVQGSIWRCKAANCTNRGITGGARSDAVLCEATGCSTTTTFFGVNCYCCTSHDNSFLGFGLANSSQVALGCVSFNNTGSNGFGFLLNNLDVSAIGCLAYGNAKSGFQDSSSASQRVMLINNLAVNNLGFGFELNGGVWAGAYLLNCAGYNNTSGNTSSGWPMINIRNFINLTGNPFNNAAGLDFSLNNLPGAGALLRASGVPSASGLYALPGLATPNYVDVGGIQHIDLFGYPRSRVVSGA